MDNWNRISQKQIDLDHQETHRRRTAQLSKKQLGFISWVTLSVASVLVILDKSWIVDISQIVSWAVESALYSNIDK